MADGFIENLTTDVHVTDNRTTGSVCQDVVSSTCRGQRTTFFYDCIDPGEDSHPDGTSLRHSGLWVVFDNVNDYFNASACLSCPMFSENCPGNRSGSFQSFQLPSKLRDTESRTVVPSHSTFRDTESRTVVPSHSTFRDTESRTVVPSYSTVRDTESRTVVPRHSAFHVITEHNTHCTEINRRQNIPSKAQNCETFSNNLQELNFQEHSQQFRILNAEKTDYKSLHGLEKTDCKSLHSLEKTDYKSLHSLERTDYKSLHSLEKTDYKSLHSLEKNVRGKCDNLTIDESVLRTETNKEGVFILTRNVVNETITDNIAAPKALNALFNHKDLEIVSDTSENQNTFHKSLIQASDEDISSVAREVSNVLVRRREHNQQGNESAAKNLEFSEGELPSECRDAKLCRGCVKDHEIQWWDVDGVGDTKIMEAGEKIDSKEKSLNFNSNAEVSSRESSRESASRKLREIRLEHKLGKLRKARESLLFYVNILLAWNLIQLLVLFGTLYYAFVCIGHFRQAFGCNEACLLRPKHLRGNEVKKSWWG